MQQRQSLANDMRYVSVEGTNLTMRLGGTYAIEAFQNQD